MSGFLTTEEDGGGFADLALTSKLGSQLTELLLCEALVPGTPASYSVCKAIYSYHPLGAKMAEAPVNMAQSQERELAVPGGPEDRLIPAFRQEWKAIGGVGADSHIHNTMRTARVYGISSIIVGDRKSPQKNSQPLPIDKLHEMDLYFSVLDPLNTAGSLVLDQDPNSPDYQKPREISVGSQTYHPSRAVIMMNEQPLYIEWTSSAFGFVGRSVYQRALFPMKTFLQSMITDDMVTKKVGLLVWKAKAPGPVTNNRILQFFGFKRSQLKGGMTGNVLTIGHEDSIESLNFQNLEGAARFSRDNALKNIAMAASMPARMLEQEELVSGFGEGTEDAKQIARYIDRVRIEMNPLYSFFDNIVQRRAWSPEFYETIKKDYPEYRKKPYETAFYEWSNSFQAVWPNLLAEPDSEKMKTEEIRFKSIVALVETLTPILDPDNKAAVVAWAADEINSRRDLFSAPLEIDEEALASYEPPVMGAAGEDGEPREPKPSATFRLDADWDESEHPRDQDGEFTSKAGGGGKTTKGNMVAAKVVSGNRVQANGQPLPAHIQKLKLPPAWTDVRYSNDPTASLLAVGKDSKGRVQSVYSADHSARQAELKFARVSALSEKFGTIQRVNDKARESRDEKTRDVADCLDLVMQTGIRPGSDSDTGAEKKAYGATTLEGRHVTQSDGKVTLRFTGKKGVSLAIPIDDNRLAASLMARKARAGDGGRLFGATTDKSLLDHVKHVAGDEFKSKDMRTNVGTSTAYKLVQSMPAPKNEKEYKKAVHEVAVQVSRKLGNTPVIALQSYISPTVFADWRMAA